MIMAIGNFENDTPLGSYFSTRRNSTMNNTRRVTSYFKTRSWRLKLLILRAYNGILKLALTLRVSATCVGIALGALKILSLVGMAHTVHAQNAPTETVRFSFTRAAGYSPIGMTNGTAGNFYVATQLGGNNQSCEDGCGNILKISPSGKATELYTFTPGPDNIAPTPIGALIRDANGVLYGATGRGGRFGWGSVFKVSPSGQEKTLYNFDPVEGDGYEPGSGITVDSEGNLYGTTYYGGGTDCNCGVIYNLTPSGSETVLYSFMGGVDGANPEGSPVILDAAGNLYGTTALGGDLSCTITSGYGCGTVWKLDTSGNFTVLYTFTGGTDGGLPEAGLVMDTSGNLYGDAGAGGDLSCVPPSGCGVVFKIDSSGNFSVIHTFVGGANDGAGPLATLLRDSDGNLYGTTVAGGGQSCEIGCGVVFKLDSSGNETILHAFSGGATDGVGPESALIADGKGNLYGTTYNGGAADDGVIFAVRE
jgi:uncharacterized repeat protein (TIGR03803 family)